MKYYTLPAIKDRKSLFANQIRRSRSKTGSDTSAPVTTAAAHVHKHFPVLYLNSFLDLYSPNSRANSEILRRPITNVG